MKLDIPEIKPLNTAPNPKRKWLKLLEFVASIYFGRKVAILPKYEDEDEIIEPIGIVNGEMRYRVIKKRQIMKDEEIEYICDFCGKTIDEEESNMFDGLCEDCAND